MQALVDKLSKKKEGEGSALAADNPAGFRRLAALNRPEWAVGALGLLCALAVGLQVGACLCGVGVTVPVSTSRGGLVEGCRADYSGLPKPLPSCPHPVCRCLASRWPCPRWSPTCGCPTQTTSGKEKP